jgi:hypothetical protein
MGIGMSLTHFIQMLGPLGQEIMTSHWPVVAAVEHDLQLPRWIFFNDWSEPKPPENADNIYIHAGMIGWTTAGCCMLDGRHVVAEIWNPSDVVYAFLNGSAMFENGIMRLYNYANARGFPLDDVADLKFRNWLARTDNSAATTIQVICVLNEDDSRVAAVEIVKIAQGTEKVVRAIASHEEGHEVWRPEQRACIRAMKPYIAGWSFVPFGVLVNEEDWDP